MKKLNVILVALVMSLALVGCQKKTPAEAEAEVASREETFKTYKALFEPRAEKGDAYAQNRVGNLYAFRKAMPWNEREAVIFYKSEGVAENDLEAVKWYRLAADQGFAEAQGNLGWMYFEGRGVAQNDVQAYKWLNLAAAQGDAKAKKNKEIVEKEMTREQIVEAQKLSGEWKPKK